LDSRGKEGDWWFTNNSTTEDVDFEIMGYSGKDLVKDLKLRKSFHTSNMHLFHPTKGIYKYSSPEEILKDFVDLRDLITTRRDGNISSKFFKRELRCVATNQSL